MGKVWVDPERFPCPERREHGCENVFCIGRRCSRWDKANDCCIRYKVGWVEVE